MSAPDPELVRAARNLNAKTFNPKLLLKERPGRPDPWAKGEVWRSTGPFTRRNRFRGMFPGFGTGVGLFAVYLVYEQLFMAKDHHHGEGHGEEHH